MIPLAAWAGMPSTACICANGHLKLFCAHLQSGEVDAQRHGSCTSSCCGDSLVGDADLCDDHAEHEADCCGGGFCCHGATPDKPGVGSKTCCNPILTSPSVAPEVVSLPSPQQAVAIAAVAPEVGGLLHSAFTVDVAAFDTGPPLDRAIVFRSLLI
jgi:hypothetical protein